MIDDKTMRRREAPLITPTDLAADATHDIGGTMNAILAAVFALYLKTIETWIDETERRTWFLFESRREGDKPRHVV